MKAPANVVGTALFAVIVLGAYWMNRSVPSPQQSTIPSAATPAPPESAKPKDTLLDNDPEYLRLQKMDASAVIKTLPSYKAAIAKRDSLIRAKVGNISDPALYSRLAEESGIPPIDTNDFASEGWKEVRRLKSEYLAAHKDDYFIVATYDNYYPSTQKAIFELKEDLGADKFVTLNNFGKPVMHDGQEVPYDPEKQFGQAIILNMPISGAYEEDYIEWVTGAGWDARAAIAITVTPAQMDAAFNAVRALLGKKMDEAYLQEANNPNSKWSSSAQQNLRDCIESYFRRQSIWVLGKGDPMDEHNIKVREAWLVVGNEQFLKIK